MTSIISFQNDQSLKIQANPISLESIPEKKIPLIDPYLIRQVNHKTRIEGAVYGREGFPDGARIITSRVVVMSGNYVITESGTQYQLGRKVEGWEG